MTWVAALIVAVAGALTTHLLATKRDRDRERNAQVERTAHYAQLRPLLRHDAEQFGIAIQELSKRGHIAPIDTTHPGELIHDDMFSGQTLVSDFPAHFPAYASERDTVENFVIGHEIALRSLRDRVADVVKMAAGSECATNQHGVQDSSGAAWGRRAATNCWRLRAATITTFR